MVIYSRSSFCGLFCESCPLYVGTMYEPETLKFLVNRFGKSVDDLRCRGCRSEVNSFYCADCTIRKCVKGKGLNFCSECDDYPCEFLKEFQIAMPHRAELFQSLDILRKSGYAAWCMKMEEDYCCKECGTINPVYDLKCRICGRTPPNPFSERNMPRIMKALGLVNKSIK